MKSLPFWCRPTNALLYLKRTRTTNRFLQFLSIFEMIAQKQIVTVWLKCMSAYSSCYFVEWLFFPVILKIGVHSIKYFQWPFLTCYQIMYSRASVHNEVMCFLNVYQILYRRFGVKNIKHFKWLFIQTAYEISFITVHSLKWSDERNMKTSC